ncbi:hypothetical protein [Pseudonocardia sp. H11422]|uniref:hypothetical protein n=1 Tax=Pseudonocardia sp. H11422 TaxID=2835866 RepID=UPI0039779E9B
MAAKRAGFDFEVISDHYFPWLDAQGQSVEMFAPMSDAMVAVEPRARTGPGLRRGRRREPAEDRPAAGELGPDVAAHVEAARPFAEAGYTHVALGQVGGQTQPEFLRFAERELLPALHEEYGKTRDPATRHR